MENESSPERFDRHVRAVNWLIERGWSQEDAAEYIGFHHVWLHDELQLSEQVRAKEIETRYGAKPGFVILNELPPEL